MRILSPCNTMHIEKNISYCLRTRLHTKYDCRINKTHPNHSTRWWIALCLFYMLCGSGERDLFSIILCIKYTFVCCHVQCSTACGFGSLYNHFKFAEHSVNAAMIGPNSQFTDFGGSKNDSNPKPFTAAPQIRTNFKYCNILAKTNLWLTNMRIFTETEQ